MYYLQRNETLKSNLRSAEGLIKWTGDRLADSAAGLTFDPEQHRYFLGGREMRSVSSIVEHFAPFEAEVVAARCSTNPRHPLFGKSVEEIVAIWKESGRQAASAGTSVHAFGEACFLYMSGREDEIEEQFKDRVKPEGLLAIEPKEMSAARWWACTDWNRYVPVAKETRIVNPGLGYAGTFDLLLYDMYNYWFAVKDYKSNKDLNRWFGEMLLAPLSMLKSNDVGKYTVQQTLYTIQLRNIGLPVGINSLIWLREEDYQEVNLEMNYDKVIAYAVSEYLKSSNSTNLKKEQTTCTE